MEVILLMDLINLGDKDDVVNVRPGYANNFLIPQGYAIQATKVNRKIWAENSRQAAHRQEKVRDEARKLADLLNNLAIIIPSLVGKEGKIFGSVTTLQIANILKEKGFDIDRRKIALPEDIKAIGNYTALISLHKDIKAELKFDVVDKEAPLES